MTHSLYDILEVSPRASQEVIQAAYRSLVQRYHPDRNSDPGSTDKLQKINRAYEILSDPAKRAGYDAAFSEREESTTSERSKDSAVERESRGPGLKEKAWALTCDLFPKIRDAAPTSRAEYWKGFLVAGVVQILVFLILGLVIYEVTKKPYLGPFVANLLATYVFLRMFAHIWIGRAMEAGWWNTNGFRTTVWVLMGIWAIGLIDANFTVMAYLGAAVFAVVLGSVAGKDVAEVQPSQQSDSL